MFQRDLGIVSWEEGSYYRLLAPLRGTICCSLRIGVIRRVAIASDKRRSFGEGGV